VRDSRVHNYPPRWNAAPSQELLVIRRNHQTGEISLDPLRWGLIPYWCNDPKGGRKPINAKCETVRTLPTFRDAYRKRRCIVPVDGFFEWKAIKGRAKQPHAIAMKDGSPFGIAGLWENWQGPQSGEWIRTFAIITTDANDLVAAIHNRMPVILSPSDYNTWLSEEEDPSDLLRPFPSDDMRVWPISTRVNKPDNDAILLSWTQSSWQRMRRNRLRQPRAMNRYCFLWNRRRASRMAPAVARHLGSSVSGNQQASVVLTCRADEGDQRFLRSVKPDREMTGGPGARVSSSSCSTGVVPSCPSRRDD
jgi:putative SOS response-associated peptidase YedK